MNVTPQGFYTAPLAAEITRLVLKVRTIPIYQGVESTISRLLADAHKWEDLELPSYAS
jgi:hypothetical protein